VRRNLINFIRVLNLNPDEWIAQNNFVCNKWGSLLQQLYDILGFNLVPMLCVGTNCILTVTKQNFLTGLFIRRQAQSPDEIESCLQTLNS